MAKKKNNHKKEGAKRSRFSFNLPERVKRYIGGLTMWLLAIIIGLSFFDQAGPAGEITKNGLSLFFGVTTFLLPIILVFAGLVFFKTAYEKFSGGVFLAASLLILGISNIFEVWRPGLKYGGYIGYASKPLFGLFGFWVTQIIFAGLTIIGILIFWHLLKGQTSSKKSQTDVLTKEFRFSRPEKSPSLIQKIFLPKFKVKEIESPNKALETARSVQPSLKEAKGLTVSKYPYKAPPLDLLESEKGNPSPGDIRMNSAIIKKTLENFAIPVEMSEINIGPTVTQYTLKPADGVKLSKITTLSNDLALALANHPIRIEAPIPGKALVGIEVPNKSRAQVRLRDLISNSLFQNSPSDLTFCLGKDVSGSPMYADLSKMPHLLVAGATGTGKTIFLNNLILSFLYRNSPEILRLILIDPKRVEFPVFNDLPHLLCPPILDSQKTVNALRWLVSEMERRFGVLSAEKARDIKSFNDAALRNETPLLPYIIVIIDELADLMAARGKEVEAAIVRLAQMARAVGIHLIVATQRPSVEVITGLIKANIIARVTFQVASQIDSRTILDSSGAEKLLGQGDLLFVSADMTKPKRIQSAYVSEKEVRKVINFIKQENFGLAMEDIEEADLETALEAPLTTEKLNGSYGQDDPLLEEAKRLVIEAKKASSSLLQRRLSVGYARAARLIDLLEEKGVVGPAEGAKPRAILLDLSQKENLEENNGWQKI